MTPQQKALQDCIEALNLPIPPAITGTEAEWENWYDKRKDAITQAKQALDQSVDANKMVQAQGEAIPHSGADENPPLFGRRWKIAADGFGLQRDDLNGRYVDIDDALSVLHATHPQASEPALDESQVEDLARSAFESALAFGIDYKSYERLAKGVWKAMLAAAPEATK
jgi:hypothetical protein